ncbi:hypothetical protein KY290_017351 [Solanum tuberosum]|uniref:Uncharacterized protein n=1 Tax=Solanum tuberosum TaxID=4113 RepID=A0ABQ7VBX6_SOLTU|nr:hypothetical protein KY285_016363 [Solanum tuberosum]KAH0761278.1 hypothetical protein KY290_017351 [Solanum tuberosum]
MKYKLFSDYVCRVLLILELELLILETVDVSAKENKSMPVIAGSCSYIALGGFSLNVHSNREGLSYTGKIEIGMNVETSEFLISVSRLKLAW